MKGHKQFCSNESPIEDPDKYVDPYYENEPETVKRHRTEIIWNYQETADDKSLNIYPERSSASDTYNLNKLSEHPDWPDGLT